jgi:hypothetical protein
LAARAVFKTEKNFGQYQPRVSGKRQGESGKDQIKNAGLLPQSYGRQNFQKRLLRETSCGHFLSQ